MNCIAIDDEPVALSVLARYCERMGGMELKCYSDPVVGMREVKRAAPDLLFLDIRMGEISGVELAREIPKGTFLVFTTAYAQYAVDGFDLDAVDFLHKPFSYPRFCRAVEKAQQLRTLRELTRQPVSEEEAITVKVEYKNVKIPLREIVYIEAMDNYVLQKSKKKKLQNDSQEKIMKLIALYWDTGKSIFELNRQLELVERKKLIEITASVCFHNWNKLIRIVSLYFSWYS